MIMAIAKSKKIIPRPLIHMLINNAEARKPNQAPRETVSTRQMKSSRNSAANRKRKAFLKSVRAKKQDRVKGIAAAK